MTTCPCCDAQNIQGVEDCALCGQPLSDLYFSDPTTLVERSLLIDRISSLNPKPPVVVDAGTPVGDVLRQLVDASIGCVLVVNQEKELCGIFSERDAIRRIGANAPQLADQPVSAFMTKNPQCLVGDAKVAFAVHSMDLGGFRHVPVLNADGKADGIISVRDILQFITDKTEAAST